MRRDGKNRPADQLATCGFCCGGGKIGEVTEYRYPADSEPKELAGQLAMTSQTACVVTETYYYEGE